MKLIWMKFVGWYQEWLELKGPNGFEVFCHVSRRRRKKKGKTGKTSVERVSEFLKRMHKNSSKNPSNEDVNNFIERIGNNGEENYLVIDGSYSDCNIELNFNDVNHPKKNLKEILDGPINFIELEVKNNPKNFKIIGAKIERLYISSKIPEEISILNCCIDHIYIPSGNEGSDSSAECIPRIQIQNSWIGFLRIKSKSADSFYVSKSWIGHIGCPNPEQESPFIRMVELVNIKMPTSGRSRVFDGIQQFRDMRSHMEKLKNGPMALYMRAKELACERELIDPGMTKAFNYLYWWVSGYNQKPGRALSLCVAFLIINIGILWSTDGVKVIAKRGTWQMDLCEDGDSNRWGRAGILALQTTINPLSVFYSKSAFTFKYPSGAILGFILSVCASASLIFFIFAIRKRMKFS